MFKSQVLNSKNCISSSNITNNNNFLGLKTSLTLDQDTNSFLSDESNQEYTHIDDNFSYKNTKNVTNVNSSTSENLFLNFFKVLFLKWVDQKALYLTIQKIFIFLNLILTLVLFGLSLWVNIDQRFVIITKMTNAILYSSFDRLIGFLPFELLAISSISLIQDLIYFGSFRFIRKFLHSHSPNQILSVIKNQRALVNIKHEFKDEQEVETLKKRIRVRRGLKIVLVNIRFLMIVQTLLTLTIFLGACFFNALYLHFNLKYIVSYELPQTLIKIIREYEKQQRSMIISNHEAMLKFAKIETNSQEEKLINQINTKFKCCNYQNPFQYGDMAPMSCNFDQGCLKPMQNFLWDYIYGSVIVLLVVGSSKFLIQLVLSFNFYVVFYRRLIKKLYYIDLKKLVDNESDDDDDSETKKKLELIRKQKEDKLNQEEEEEELRAIQEENEFRRMIFLDKKQEEYEKMLLKQKRFKELRHEQMQRRLQTQHLLESNET